MTDSIRDDNLAYWLWLTIAFGAANPRKWEALNHFSGIRECYEQYSAANYIGLTQEEKRAVASSKMFQAGKIIEYCKQRHIELYCYESEGYPQRLREIYNPPSVLFCYGSLDFLDDKVSVAIVGARDASDYSLNVTDNISRELAQSGVIVVSGFAVGIDRTAHRGAIDVGGKTVAVLASGLEYDYPKGSMPLKRELAANGAVVSEFFPAHKPRSIDFKARNRILSGLSLGVLVTEASRTSGSLNTVSYAVNQGRDIFCIPPHEIFNPRYLGMADLLRDGAIPVFSHKDILYEYYENYSHKLNFSRNAERFMLKTDDSVMFSESEMPKTVKRIAVVKTSHNENINAVAPKTKEVNYDGMNDVQIKICKSLEGGAKLIDEISAEIGIDIASLLSEMTELEMNGDVISLAGKRFTLA